LVRTIECPIPKCDYRGFTLEGLAEHLWFKHRKNELVGWIINEPKQKEGLKDAQQT